MSKPGTIELTPEQLGAVQANYPSLVVRAAAGAGKTRVLVERLLRHVTEDGMRPDEILAVTFTRKAAAEMKQRIVGRLIECGRPEDAQIAETGPIQTLHGFCERMLRECSVIAGLDPDFEVLDEATQAQWMHDAIQEAIADAQAGSLADALIEALAGKSQFGAVSPHARLEMAIHACVESFRGTMHSPEVLEEIHASPDILLERWRGAWIASLDTALRSAFEASDPTLPFGLRLRAAYRALRRATPKGLATEANLQEAERADRACAEATCGLVSLATCAWRSFERRMEAERKLDFVALEAQAVRLLEESEVVRDRLRRQYKVALVDEAQDLSPQQYRLLASLGIEVEMLVGDAQQSIYGFRQAEVRLFVEKAQMAAVMPLTRNFRSEPGILAFVDELFLRAWGEEYVPMARRSEGLDFEAEPAGFEGVEIWRQKQKDTAQVAAWIEELLTEGFSPGQVAVLVRTASYAQDLLPKLEARGIPARIAGGTERFYTRLEVRDLANALHAMADPYDDFALLATLRSPVADLSLDTIALLALHKPIVEALPEFVTPVEADAPSLERFLDWFIPARRKAWRLSAWECLSILLAQSAYLENLAARPNPHPVLANVRKLLRLAAAKPELGPLEFAREIRRIRELRHREGDAPTVDDAADVVTLMTVHKAKGLEFDVVVLPDVFGRLAKPVGEVEIEKWLGLCAAGFEGEKSAFLHWIVERRKERERQEELRVLYVAMTRAKRRLCVVAHSQASGSTLAGRIAELIGLDHGPPRGARSRE